MDSPAVCFRHDREALPAVAIADPAHITCVGNDYGFDYIFSKYLEAHGKAGDVLLAISTSGNSVNILKGSLILFPISLLNYLVSVDNNCFSIHSIRM